jgi:ABC-type sulfate/molybdate transport systems ATPase subunit/ABC-type sulfate transport system permease component
VRRSSWPLLPWLGGLLAVYLVAPLVAGLAHLGGVDWRGADWATLGDACAVSLLSATVATLLVAAGGIPLGYLLARRPGRWMALLGFVVQLPLALPPLASGILLLFLLGYASPLGALTHGALTDSFFGIVLAEAFVAAPFLIIAARSAFAALDPVLEDVAATLGHRPWSVFLRASLPLACRAILAGMLLAWLRAFGEFGATVMVAYHPYSLPVYTYVAFGGQGLPAMLPVLAPTLVAAVGVMGLAAIFGADRVNRMGFADRRTGVVPLPIAPLLDEVQRSSVLSSQPLSFAFRRKLSGFDLDVAWRTSARRLAILGASGSGKSMTLRAIAGLDGDVAGSLMLGAKDLSETPTEQRRIAFVPQNYGLFPHLTVARQITFAVGADRDLTAHWLKRLGLSGLEQRLPDALSLGQQQRVAVARAFSRPAGLLLLDEPFSALDTPLRAQLRRELLGLQAEIDATTILVTHDPDEAFLLADELLILDAGRVLQVGTVNEVFARPASEVVARLLGAENIAFGHAVGANCIDVGERIQIEVAGPPLQTGARIGWSVRPESVAITAAGDYPGLVVDVAAPIAGRCDIGVRIGDALLRANQEIGASVGLGPCRLGLRPEAVQVWVISAEGGTAADMDREFRGTRNESQTSQRI